MDPKILIIGASGFVGTNLLNAFEKSAVKVRAMTRHPETLIAGENVEVVRADLDDPQSLKSAMQGIDTIYYLAHSMDYAGHGFSERDKIHARNLASHLTDKHLLVYLGVISPEGSRSPHITSRKEVGEIFSATEARTIEFQASIIVGRGSSSFELIRALVTRLPFVLTGSWAQSVCQPIAIKDVIEYLVRAPKAKIERQHCVLEIGGSERLRYSELLSAYAKAEGLLRPNLFVKSLPKAIAKEVIKLIVPEYYPVGEKLLDGIETNTVAKDEEALKIFDFIPIGYSEAVRLARDPNLKEADFSDALAKLASHPEIPRHLSGQTLQAGLRLKVPAIKLLKRNGLFAKIPMLGELKILAGKAGKSVVLLYKPRYFFQAASWALFEGISKRLSGKKA